MGHRHITLAGPLALLLPLFGALTPAAGAEPVRVVSAPAIAGVPSVGAELSASEGIWTPVDGIPTYRWLRCDAAGETCAATGAEGRTYRIVAADIGHRLAVRLIVRWGTTEHMKTSDPTDVVQDGPVAPPPVNEQPPAISGVAQAGSVLTTSTGSWSSAQPMTFTYSWERCDSVGASCTPIPEGTIASYAVTDADVDHALRVAVTATSSAGSTTVDSAPTAAVAGSPPRPPTAPTNAAVPVVSGAAVVGTTLAAGTGAWAGEGPYSFAYQWLRCDAGGEQCAALPEATATGYLVVAGDAGARLRVRVTASTAGGSATALSAPTPIVAPADAGTTEQPSASPGGPALTTAGTANPAPGSSVTTPAAAVPPAARPVLMDPFPRLRVAGRFAGSRTWLTLVSVRAPRDARIDIRCTGSGCPKARHLAAAGRRRLRFVERAYRAGAVLEFRVTRASSIGKYVRIAVRAGRAPTRRDACVRPNSDKPVPCPAT